MANVGIMFDENTSLERIRSTPDDIEICYIVEVNLKNSDIKQQKTNFFILCRSQASRRTAIHSLQEKQYAL